MCPSGRTGAQAHCTFHTPVMSCSLAPVGRLLHVRLSCTEAQVHHASANLWLAAASCIALPHTCDELQLGAREQVGKAQRRFHW